MKHSLFYPSVVGFIVGVFIRSITSIGTEVIVFLFFTSLCLIAYTVYSRQVYAQAETKTYSLFFLTLIFLISSSLGTWRYHLFVKDFYNDNLKASVDEIVEVEGIVVDEPAEKSRGMRLTVQLEKIKIIATDSLYSEVAYGDRVKIEGTLVLPENFEGDNGREFDYISYLAKDNIFYEIKNPHVTIIGHNEGNNIKEILFALKGVYVQNIDDAISYPESSLAAGLTIAGKKSLPSTIQDEFQRTGTLQLVVLSGYNITIVAESFMMLTSFLSTYASAAVGVAGIILFTIMAGGSATIVRGSIMAIVCVAATLLRRRYNVIRSLVVTALIMLVVNPMLLVYDPSFQLSFLATIGLILVSPIVEKRLSWITERAGLRQVVAATLATQIFVTPFILYTSGELSLVAIPANLMLFLFIPITMLVSFITGMAGFVSGTLAAITGYLPFLLLKYELMVIHVLASFKYALITISSFPLWVMTLVYMSFIVFIWKFYQKEKT